MHHTLITTLALLAAPAVLGEHAIGVAKQNHAHFVKVRRDGATVHLVGDETVASWSGGSAPAPPKIASTAAATATSYTNILDSINNGLGVPASLLTATNTQTGAAVEITTSASIEPTSASTSVPVNGAALASSTYKVSSTSSETSSSLRNIMESITATVDASSTQSSSKSRVGKSAASRSISSSANTTSIDLEKPSTTVKVEEGKGAAQTSAGTSGKFRRALVLNATVEAFQEDHEAAVGRRAIGNATYVTVGKAEGGVITQSSSPTSTIVSTPVSESPTITSAAGLVGALLIPTTVAVPVSSVISTVDQGVAQGWGASKQRHLSTSPNFILTC